jgi:hypothetical protein
MTLGRALGSCGSVVDLGRRCGSGVGLVEKLLFWNRFKGEVVVL